MVTQEEKITKLQELLNAIPHRPMPEQFLQQPSSLDAFIHSRREYALNAIERGIADLIAIEKLQIELNELKASISQEPVHEVNKHGFSE